MKITLGAEFPSEGFNTCMGCALAIFPGEMIYLKPTWGYPTKPTTHASYGKDEVICASCAGVASSVTHDVHCLSCINPNIDKEHVWECPNRP